MSSEPRYRPSRTPGTEVPFRRSGLADGRVDAQRPGDRADALAGRVAQRRGRRRCGARV